MKDPIEQFGELYERLPETDLAEPTAVALATANAGGRPSVRMVLLKEYGPEGFVFYTNLRSRKGRDLAENPRAALCFHWEPLDVQVQIEGPVSPVTREEADRYFASRARESQVGAWASLQSSRLGSAHELEERILEIERRFAGVPIPRPDFWSGFRLRPGRIEFWKRGLHRLHARELYTRDQVEGGEWAFELLYP